MREMATCRKKIYGRQRCGALVELIFDGVGRLVEHCPLCDRHRRGLCRGCPNRTEGKALWCAGCRVQRRRDRERQDKELQARKNARYRRRWRTDSKFRARRLETKRAWIKANPDRVKRAKRRFLTRDGPARQHYLEYHRKNNAKRRQHCRDIARRRYYELHPVRPDPHCAGCKKRIPWQPLPRGRSGAPPKWCDDCCTPAEKRRRAQRRARREEAA